MSKENENRKGYKKTKVGWIPEDWELSKLGSISKKIGSGKTPRGGRSVYTRTGIPLIRSQNIRLGALTLENVARISPQTHSAMASSKVRAQDLLLNITGASLGRSCVVPMDFKEGNVNQHVCIIRLTETVSRFFINCYLTSENGQRTIFKSQVGGNREGLNFENVASIRIPLPPLAEQEKIAEVLGVWDKAIGQTRSLLAQLQLRKKGLAQVLLTGKQRLPGFSEEWREVRLGEVADRITTKNSEGNDSVITISAKSGFVKQESFFKKRVASKTLTGYYLINRGDFAYNKSYSKGYPMGAIKRLDNFEKAVVTTLYICFRLKKNLDSDFFINLSEAGRLTKALSKVAQEGGRAHGLLNIGVQDFFDVKFHTPNNKEQQAISRILTEADKEIGLYKQKLAALETQKKGLMGVLLSGERRISLQLNITNKNT